MRWELKGHWYKSEILSSTWVSSQIDHLKELAVWWTPVLSSTVTLASTLCAKLSKTHHISSCCAAPQIVSTWNIVHESMWELFCICWPHLVQRLYSLNCDTGGRRGATFVSSLIETNIQYMSFIIEFLVHNLRTWGKSKQNKKLKLSVSKTERFWSYLLFQIQIVGSCFWLGKFSFVSLLSSWI